MEDYHKIRYTKLDRITDCVIFPGSTEHCQVSITKYVKLTLLEIGIIGK